MQDFRKKLNVAAALRQQQQQQQQQHHHHHHQQQQLHNQNMAVFPTHHGQQTLRPPPPHHLLNNWNLLNSAGFTQRPGPHLPPPLMHSPHAMAQMPRNPALFNGSLMAPRFQTPPLHQNLPSQQFQTPTAVGQASPFDFYQNKMLMN